MRHRLLYPIALTSIALLLAGCVPVDSATPPAVSPSAFPTTTSIAGSPSATITASEQPTAPAESPVSTSLSPTASASLTPPVNDGYRIDPAALATTDIVTGTPVDPATYAFPEADQPSVVFQTPDQQVACLMQPYGAFCMTDDSVNWVLLSVSMSPGDTRPRSIQAQGRSATHPWFGTHRKLDEGQSLSWMGMTCVVTGSSSVQCNDGANGFNLSDANGR